MLFPRTHQIHSRWHTEMLSNHKKLKRIDRTDLPAMLQIPKYAYMARLIDRPQTVIWWH